MPPDIPAEGEIWEGGGRRFRMEKVVGNGAFGIVWRAKEEGSDQMMAIKKVVLQRMANVDESRWLVPPPPPSAHAEPRDGVVVSSYVIDVEAEEEEGGGDEPTGRSRTRRGRLVGEINLLMAEALRQMARRAIVEYDEFLQARATMGWG